MKGHEANCAIVDTGAMRGGAGLKAPMERRYERTVWRLLWPLVAVLKLIGQVGCTAGPSVPIAPASAAVEAAAEVQVIRTEIRLTPPQWVRYPGTVAATQAQFPQGFPRSLGSGICLKGVSGETLEFWVLGDRGPNADGPGVNGRDSKVFPVPEFNPAFGIVRLQRRHADVAALIDILQSDGGKTSGLPTPPISAAASQELALTEALTALPADPDGIDPEAIAYDGRFVWLSDEYGPVVLKVDPANGRILERLLPGRGLPTIFAKRRLNRGMEALTYEPATGRLWGTLQSAIDDGQVASGQNRIALRDAARFIRWVEIDPKTRAHRQFAYPIDAEDYWNGETGQAKLGDLVALGGGLFVVIEEGAGRSGQVFHRLFLVDANAATILDDAGGSDLERSSIVGHPVHRANWAAVSPLRKRLLLDLNRLGWKPEKAEGLALVDERTLVVVNDNDYGLASVLVDANGRPRPGNVSHCLASGRGPVLFGERCPAGALSVAMVRMPEESLAQVLWVIRFPQPIRTYQSAARIPAEAARRACEPSVGLQPDCSEVADATFGADSNP